ncbi:hypothetical protein, partial [Bradyrhizobium sp. NAS80.1]|uniref:hypothetical protein n=1 Tax=Bradyrhizobium sp. NAS80.1 TaxID=1680159 RepID=UPI001AEF3FFC
GNSELFLFRSQPLSACAEPVSEKTPIAIGTGVTLDQISTTLRARFSLDYPLWARFFASVKPLSDALPCKAGG